LEPPGAPKSNHSFGHSPGAARGRFRSTTLRQVAKKPRGTLARAIFTWEGAGRGSGCSEPVDPDRGISVIFGSTAWGRPGFLDGALGGVAIRRRHSFGSFYNCPEPRSHRSCYCPFEQYFALSVNREEPKITFKTSRRCRSFFDRFCVVRIGSRTTITVSAPTNARCLDRYRRLSFRRAPAPS